MHVTVYSVVPVLSASNFYLSSSSGTRMTETRTVKIFFSELELEL